MKAIIITLAVLLALVACGDGSQEAEQEGNRRVITVAPPSTPTPDAERVMATIAAELAGKPSLDEYIEFLDEICIASGEREGETNRGFVRYLEDAIEQLEESRPPEELRDYVDAAVAMMAAVLEFAEERDPGTRLDEDTGWQDYFSSPEFGTVLAALNEAQEALDPGLALRVQAAGC